MKITERGDMIVDKENSMYCSYCYSHILFNTTESKEYKEYKEEYEKFIANKEGKLKKFDVCGMLTIVCPVCNRVITYTPPETPETHNCGD